MARDSVDAVVAAVRAKSVRVRFTAPAAGRLEVRVLDSRGRTLSRQNLRFSAEGRRTLTLKTAKRGRTISVRWTPHGGTAETAKRRL